MTYFSPSWRSITGFLWPVSRIKRMPCVLEVSCNMNYNENKPAKSLHLNTPWLHNKIVVPEYKTFKSGHTKSIHLK